MIDKMARVTMCLVVKPPMMPPIMPAMNSDDVKSCRPWLLYLLQVTWNRRCRF